MTDHTNVPVVATGDWIDAAWINQYIGDNFRAMFQAYLAAGDMAYAIDADTIGRLTLTPGGVLIGGAAAPSWLAVPGSLALLMHNGSAPSWLTGGSAYQLLRKNSANNGLEYVSIGAWSCAKRSSNLTGVAATDNTVVTWNAYDGENWHTTTKLTAPVAGDYRLSGAVRISAASVYRNYEVKLRINGTTYITVAKNWSSDSYDFAAALAGRIVTLAAGDYVEMTVSNCNGTVYAEGSWMQMERVK